ncbi:MAG: DUF2007 domain-containing protein [Porticoccaceae bacterium]|nr:DUF2007 domain-containing protein [Porticoccaceae bacterium]
MHEVYASGDYLEAQILLGLLLSRSVDAVLRGADLQGGVGDLAPNNMFSLRVASADKRRAHALLADYYAGELSLESNDINLD